MPLSTRTLTLLLSLAASVAPLSNFAQTAAIATPVPSRLTAKIDDAQRSTLPGVVHPLASAANDRGRTPDSTPLKRLQIVLKKSDAQEAALKQLVDDLHNPASPSFHQWLTPEQFGKQFGPSDADVATLSTWLASKGFTVTGLTPGRQTLEFEGTSGQFRDAFQTEVHNYAVRGVTRHSINAMPQIPAALTPLVGGFTSLNNFTPRSPIKTLGKASYDPLTHISKPSWTTGSSNALNFFLAPSDFAIQYDTAPLLAAGTNGTGQTIAVINISNVNVYLVNQYRKLFSLPTSPLQVIVDGADPGLNGINNPDGENGFLTEAYLDVEMTGMAAPGANIDLVIAGDTALSDGFSLASEHAVYNNLAPIMSLSVEECEIGLGSGGNAFYNTLWQQAAAQGITVVVAASDSGSAGCDNFDTQQYATYGQQVNGFASTPYNIAVGGTDFYYSSYASGGTALAAQVAGYWNETPSNNTPVTSIKGVIPEQPWNDSQYGLNAVNYYASYGETTIVAGSGGASTCGIDVTACAPYAKPVWQSGTGVPADKARDLPDISVFAANGSNYASYPICAGDGDCQPVAAGSTVQVEGAGGTSASAPAFAGIMALINQKYGRQGQANYTLYPLAAQYPAAFHDVTVGTNTVPCNIAKTPSGEAPMNCIAVANPITVPDQNYGTGSVVEGEVGSGTTADYKAGVGYDLATGLGSVDVNVLMTDWGKVSFAGTSTTLTPSATSFAHGTSVSIAGKVTSTGGTTPTGQVALMTTSTTVNNQSQTNYTLAAGSYSGALSTLPGGTYTLYGRYAGDTANAASVSSPVNVTVTAETSATALEVAANGSLLAAGGTVSYGTPVSLESLSAPTAQLTALVNCEFHGGTCPAITRATGAATFAETGVSLPTVPLNANGEGFDDYNAALGTHTVTASYSGDASYSASASSPVTFTVGKDTPALSAAKNSSYPGFDDGGVKTFTFLVTNSNYSAAYAAAPTGTLTFTGGPAAMPTSAVLTPAINPNNNSAAGVATITLPANTPTGSYTVRYSYPGDTNYAAASSTYVLSIVAAEATYPSTIAATVLSSTATPGASASLSVTVTGSAAGGTPTGYLFLYSDGLLYNYVPLPTGTGTSITDVLAVSNGLFAGGNVVTVEYISFSGVYQPAETTVSISSTAADFTLQPASSVLNSSTGSVTDAISVGSAGGFAGPVALACTATGGVTCSLSFPSVTLPAGGTAISIATLNTSAATGSGPYTAVVTGMDATGQYIHTATLTVNVPSGTTSPLTLTAAGAITIPTQGASGSTTLTLAAGGSFSGNVALTCAVTAGPAGYVNAPACGVTTPVNVQLASTAAATLTINTTPQTKAALGARPGGWLAPAGGAVFAAALLCLLLPTRRRRLPVLALTFAAFLLLGTATGCAGSTSSSSSTGGGTLTGGTTLGSYTVTVNAADVATGKVTASVNVTAVVN